MGANTAVYLQSGRPESWGLMLTVGDVEGLRPDVDLANGASKERFGIPRDFVVMRIAVYIEPEVFLEMEGALRGITAQLNRAAQQTYKSPPTQNAIAPLTAAIRARKYAIVETATETNTPRPVAKSRSF